MLLGAAVYEWNDSQCRTVMMVICQALSPRLEYCVVASHQATDEHKAYIQAIFFMPTLPHSVYTLHTYMLVAMCARACIFLNSGTHNGNRGMCGNRWGSMQQNQTLARSLPCEDLLQALGTTSISLNLINRHHAAVPRHYSTHP